jgi:EAL domain-containing protein (putative c-di-GMP-specific phosphodiesterase class I)
MALSINLSARAFSDPALFAEVQQLLGDLALAPEAVTFEITETEAIANLVEAQQLIWRLKELGCRFALDDFGSGFASFTYLRDLPTDLVKIDGKFVRELPHSSLDRAIVHALVDIAHTLGKEVVAEFVDSGTTLSALRMMGVEHGQGFYLGRPDEAPAPPEPGPAAAGDLAEGSP